MVYLTAHIFLDSKLRNTANLYTHLLSNESISWTILSIISLTENETTDESRLFLQMFLCELFRLIGFDKIRNNLRRL